MAKKSESQAFSMTKLQIGEPERVQAHAEHAHEHNQLHVYARPL